jgi:hypothetical protein
MRTTCRLCLCVSALVISVLTVNLIRADIHEGTGGLLGLCEYNPGNCEGGGSNCKAASQNHCGAPDATDYGECSDNCPGTAGETCHEDAQGEEMCKDDSEVCPKGKKGKCVENGKDIAGHMTYKCDDTETTEVECGCRNTCPTQEQ